MDCKRCGCGRITGGMRGHAEKVGMKVSDKNYRYCVKTMKYVDAGNTCEKYRPKKTVVYGLWWLSWRRFKGRKSKRFIKNDNDNETNDGA